MKLPRDLSGDQLTKLLRQFGYEVTRQTGSHMRATSKWKGTEQRDYPGAQGTSSGDIVRNIGGCRELFGNGQR